MSQTTSQILDAAEKGRLRLLMHGSIIGVIGLVSGFGFLFVILDAINVWPFFNIAVEGGFPGSDRGWRVAHVAGVMNGMLMIIGGLALVHVLPTLRAQAWIVWGLVYTGWGNTIFFHCANLSNNRGLSGGVTKYGEADFLGTIGYIIGASTIPFTITALVLVALSARRLLRTG
jgi:hypothetical protein